MLFVRPVSPPFCLKSWASGVLLLLFLAFPFSFLQAQGIDSLELNNIKLKVRANGMFGNDTANLPGSTMEFPIGSGKKLLHSGGLWIGGKDPSGALSGSWSTFLLDSTTLAFHPGPVADQYDAGYASDYEHLWRMDRDSLEYHANNWWTSGYQMPQMIQEWPAHGDTSNGEAYRLAKFHDVDGDGDYEPQNGDRPIMRGDRMLYFISKDEMGGPFPLGVEVHGTVYAWDCPNSTTLNNSILIHYEIINRSNTSYDSVLVGNWSDFDVGCYSDDFVGTDVERGIAFGYNGDPYDEDCSGDQGYENLLPAIGNVFLKGPELDPNGIDDSFPGAGRNSVSGVGFGDGILDNEHFGMEYSAYYNNGAGPQGNPVYLQEYYGYLQAEWKDGTPFSYGGDAYDPTGSNPVTRFVYPWSSDPLNYATGGTPSSNWSEGSSGSAAGDRRILGSSGPVSLNPGDTLKLDMAYVAAQDPSNPGDSVAPVMVMKERVDSLRHYFLNDAVPCSDGSFSSLQERKAASFEVDVYPNPSRGRFNVELEEGSSKPYRYELYSMRGELLQEGSWNGTRNELRIEEKGSGIYFLRLRSGERSVLKKLIKH